MIEVIHGDSLREIEAMPDGSFDLILTDPPYAETILEWDAWPIGWPAAVRRLLKPTGSMWVFGSARMFFDRANEFGGWRLAQDVVWEKHNGSGFHADRFKRVHENAYQFYRDDSPWADVYKAPQFTNDATARTVRRKTRPTHMGNIEAGAYSSHDGGPKLQRSVIYVRSEHGRAIHPTQKPIGIVEPLALYSCPLGGRILDLFAGSGTTGLVAKRNGMHATLIEADAKFVEAIKGRLADDAPLFEELADA